MAEYQLKDGAWACSSGRVWLPGCYETRKAARLAYRLSPQRLHDLWKSKADPDGIIRSNLTEDEMRAALREDRNDG